MTERPDQPNPEPEPRPEAAAPEAATNGAPEGASGADTPAAELALLNERLLRALAEVENVRRRGEREREDASKFAITGFARDIVSVAENLRRALAALPSEGRPAEGPLATVLAGVEMTERELLQILERHGVRRVDPVGEKFDHNLHQAMMELTETDAAPGTVVQVLQAGYTLRERLLRPAMVAVARPKTAPVDTIV
ncbi:MAG: nucleotide exchange factor GrpE [Alphaproteobacteria bacterium]|nr:nucleotide exchange factor GrpE [Alphaproteobacteria bacterium]